MILHTGDYSLGAVIQEVIQQIVSLSVRVIHRYHNSVRIYRHVVFAFDAYLFFGICFVFRFGGVVYRECFKKTHLRDIFLSQICFKATLPIEDF